MFLPAAAMALAAATLPAPHPRDASAQTVSFSIDPLYCPGLGVYGISRVTVEGTGDLTASQNFLWTTQTAKVSIGQVPPEGAVAWVTVTYRCKVQVLWWQEAGSSQYATAARWVNGTGPQPSYTLVPESSGTPAP